MADQEERRRILDMLAKGQLNVDEAEELLRAVDAESEDEFDIGRLVDRHAAAIEAAAIAGIGRGRQRHRQRRIARSLRIVIDAGEEGKNGRTAVTVPVALAKFAGKLIPEEMRTRLESEGIELADLLQALDEDLPEGRLVDIDTGSEGGQRARIIVEVA